MQFLKENIRNQILTAARRQFLEKGYLKASMRDIADESGVGVGNLYNYFSSKDDLFRAVVFPVTSLLEQMLQKHHGARCADVTEMLGEEYCELCVNEYVELVKRQKDLMMLLYFRAQGSSLEGYLDDFSDHATEVTKGWLERINKNHPSWNVEVMDFTIRLHVVWMFAFMRELLLHPMDEAGVKRALSDYIRFEVLGWKRVIMGGRA